MGEGGQLTTQSHSVFRKHALCILSISSSELFRCTWIPGFSKTKVIVSKKPTFNEISFVLFVSIYSSGCSGAHFVDQAGRSLNKKHSFTTMPGLAFLFLITKKIQIYFYFMCMYFYFMSVLPAYMYLYYVCAWGSQKSEEGVRALATGVTDSCEEQWVWGAEFKSSNKNKCS